MSSLLLTKLSPPSMPPKRVQRLRLVERLNEGLQSGRRITLVSAPAGFGKTTCINEWINTLDFPVAWLSLDPSDDDPGSFFDYFIAALQKVDTKLGREIQGVLRAGQLPPSDIISTTLVNDILDLDNQFLLVLDDFHVIQDRFILQVLEQMVTNLPQPLRLVLLTREDPPLPMARLRANNQLTEIRAGDLRFTNRDIDCFLNEVIGLSLTPADIAILEEKTEGWVAGLQLAGLSIRDQVDPSEFILSLSGSNRFILSYLTEQVVSQQTERTKQFLLQTSILDTLTPDLCNAVTGRSDSRALLERLYNANLFLMPLDNEQQWYRYHHLFVDLLRDLQDSLQKGMTAELHQRASHWYASKGMGKEAIQHALAAEDYAMAVDLLESHAMDMIMQGYAKTLNGWVQALPEEWRSQSPRTNLAFAWALLLRGAYSQASEYLERLKATLIDSPVGEDRTSIQAEWLVMQSLMLYMQGKITECEEMATQALELSSEGDSRVRSLAYYVQASVSWSHENYRQAAIIFRKSIQHSKAAENLVAEMMSTISLAGMALENGQLNLAFEIASQAVERMERSGVLHPISAVLYASLGDAYYQWYQIEEARRNFQRALHLSTLGGSNTITIACHVLLSRLSHIEGDLDTAAREIQKAADLLPLEVPEYIRQEVVSQQVRVYLALDRPAAAEIALRGPGFSFDEQHSFLDIPADYAAQASFQGSISYSKGLLYNSFLRLLLSKARTENDPVRLKSGIEFAEGLIDRAFKSQQLMVALETLLLRAQMYAELEDLPASKTDYVRVLRLAEPELFIGVFVEHGLPVAEALSNLVRQNQLGDISLPFVERVLDAFAVSLSPQSEKPGTELHVEGSPVKLVEPLTERELEVLRLMAEGLKYKEIAERLFISLNTVRYHVKAIYSKLNASNRIQAIELARQRRLM